MIKLIFMSQTKKVLSVTIDADLYAKIDKICEIQGDSRSAFVERVLYYAALEKEEVLSDLESPINRAIYDILAKTPDKLIHMATRMVGEKLTNEELERIRKNTPLLAEEGKKRQTKKKGGKRDESSK